MATAKATTDHDEIRRWVEARGGHPARVAATGSRKDPGILRIDFPGFSGEDSLEEIEWEEFFDWFDRNNLAALLSTARGNRFNKLVDRATAGASSGKKRASSKKKAAGSKKSASKKSSAKKSSAKKSSSKKSSAKKASATKSSAKKSSAKKASTKKSSAKKSTTKRSASKKSSAKKSSSKSRSAAANTTTDHDEIRNWVESRGGFPAHVKRTGRARKDPGVLRIDYPGYSGAGSLERIDWDTWFEAFEKNKLAFLYQDKRGSRFSKLVNR